MTHAPGHIRQTFLNAIEAFMAWNTGEPEPTCEHEVKYEIVEIPISKACGMVWNCRDIMPGVDYRQLLDCGMDIKRQTYAACARAMMQRIKSLGLKAEEKP